MANRIITKSTVTDLVAYRLRLATILLISTVSLSLAQTSNSVNLMFTALDGREINSDTG
jgi:hypothetical protein